MSNIKLPVLLDLDAIRRLTGKSPRTIYRWRQRGTGPVSVKIGGQLFWDREDVIDWLATNREKTGRGGK
jgi:predicted DNA-binding transcriptional regulator AlpA